jgi:hypothetical protein
MNKTFEAHVASIIPAFDDLVSPKDRGPIPKAAGVYILFEGNAPLLVGRSRDLNARQAWNCSGNATQATFAFTLARVAMEHLEPRSGTSQAKRWLMQDIRFASEFARAKERVSRMAFHWVREADPVRQALLELYTAIAMQTPFNTFKLG